MKAKEKILLWLGHYKWYILIILFFVVFVSIMALQTCTREEYDISVMYAGPAVIADSHNSALEETLGKLANDNDGDGKSEVVFYDLIIMTEDELKKAYDKGHSTSAINAVSIQDAKDAFQLNILSDDHFVLMLSPERYSVMIENGALEKLSDIGVTAENPYSEYAVRLAELDFARFYTAFSVLPEDTLLCFKRISDVNADKRKVLDRRENAIEYMKSLTEYRLPDGVILASAAAYRKEEL